MGQSAEELRREIESTRNELGGTLDAIGDRVSPGRMIERKKNRVTNGFRSAKDRVMGVASTSTHTLEHRTSDAMSGAASSVREAPHHVVEHTEGSPMAAGAIAAGIGFLLAAMIPPSQKEQRATQHLMESAEPLKQELTGAAKEVAEHLKEPAKDAVTEVKGAATGAVDSVKGVATEAASSTKDEAQHAAQDVKQQAGSSSSS